MNLLPLLALINNFFLTITFGDCQEGAYTHTVATLKIDDDYSMSRCGRATPIHNNGLDWNALADVVNKAIGNRVSISRRHDDALVTGSLVSFRRDCVALDTSEGRIDYPLDVIGELDIAIA